MEYETSWYEVVMTAGAAGDSSVDGVDNNVTRRGGDDRERNVTDNFAPRTSGGEPPEPKVVRGSDLARQALRAARESAARRDRPAGDGVARRRRRWSGARPDDRDPQPLGRLAARLARDRGWADRLAGGQVFGRWPALVGADVAEHTQPVELRDGELTVRADSTAWATQLRLLQRQLLARIAAGVGHGVVARLKVQGPAAPSWRHGPKTVPGRGPRDTYG